jgi:hypothetical protein
MFKLIATTITALAATTACASGGPQPYSEAASANADEIVIHVTNNNFNAVTIRAVTGGQSFRLGTVETSRDDDFVVPPAINPLDLRFEVEALGSDERFVTEPLAVTYGSAVHMDVNQTLVLTNVIVRNP